MKKLLFVLFGLMFTMFVSCTDQTQDVFSELPQLSVDDSGIACTNDDLGREVN